MRYRFYTADVFTDRVFGGNPLAVFPDAFGLTTEKMCQIAKEFNLSETVFVFPPESSFHTSKLRIFTPVAELPFAGHPTLGAAHILTLTGSIPLHGDVTQIAFEEGVGPVVVTVHNSDRGPGFAQFSVAIMPEFQDTLPAIEDIAPVLSLPSSSILDAQDVPQAVSCGVPFLMIPVVDRVVIGQIRLNLALWNQRIAGTWAPHLYVFTRDTERTDAQFHARMFAPGLGVSEDPATGGGAAAFGGYLAARSKTKDGTLKWRIEQGLEMGRPSILDVEADKQAGQIVAVRVGGTSVLVSEGWMEIP